MQIFGFKLVDFLLILVLAAVIGFSLSIIYRRKKKGQSCSSCGNCPHAGQCSLQSTKTSPEEVKRS